MHAILFPVVAAIPTFQTSEPAPCEIVGESLDVQLGLVDPVSFFGDTLIRNDSVFVKQGEIWEF